jgi:DNA mismatch repair protein MutS2
MAIAEQTLETLEFPKIRARLAQHTAFSASRALALALYPSSDHAEIVRRLRLTSEARRLLDEEAQATIGGARDVREAARHAQRGGVLDASVFLEIANTLRSARRLRGLLFKIAPDIYPLLSEMGHTLPEISWLEEAIERTIGDDGGVLDSASPALGRLRREIRTAAARLQERLNNLLHAPQYADVLQESIVTVRDGRYVVPVKASQRRALSGLVHDQSASGATLYIEPMAVVELNNQWREAQLAEEQEVKRILGDLSARVGDVAEALVLGIETLAEIDLFFAQAKYALALRCSEPEIIEQPAFDAAPAGLSETAAASPADAPLRLIAARHPLLNQETVVPIDIWLGASFRLLLITGPNTGGKTVALKTVGLLALMAQAGLHIPARGPARLPIFDQVFADIGDEQSIEQSLSTFSSHMTTIIRILEALEAAHASADDEPRPALVLLDELGAGTDPVEGAALARAISGRLLARNCLAVCTTHYAELKAFAHETPGVENASVEFDIDTLSPTYRLTIGLPGRSNALAIAARLGLEAELVATARSTVTREEAQIEGLLANIHREREAAAAELQRASELRADAEKYRDRYAEQVREFHDTLDTRIADATRQLEQEIQAAQHELRRLRDESRSATLSRQWAQEAEQHLRDMREQVQQTGESLRASSPAAEQRAAQGDTPPRPLQVGDSVLVRSVGLQGEILSIDEEDQMASVQVGGFRMEVGLNELRRDKQARSRERTPPRTETPSVSMPAVPDVPMHFDMRGWRAADVSEGLDRYLHDAYRAGLPEVRLVHGKGSGVLRQVVRDMLRQHRLVRSFTGGGADGGEGVTVASLVER